VARHRLTRGSRRVWAGLLLALLAVLPLLLWARAAGGQAERAQRAGTAILLLVDNVSFEELMAVPEFRGLSRSGGSALMAASVPKGDRGRYSFSTIWSGTSEPGESEVVGSALQSNGVHVCLLSLRVRFQERERCAKLRSRASERDPVLFVVPAKRPADTLEVGGGAEGLLLRLVGELGTRRTLVLAVGLSPSPEMVVSADGVTPIVMGRGSMEGLLVEEGPLNGLTSDTTRRDGLVSNVDVAPTILDFFRIPIPAEMEGQPIRVTEADAPFDLHQRHLEQRRIRVPVQIGEVAFIAVLGLMAIAALIVLAVRGGLPFNAAARMRFLALCGVALPIPLLLGGILPRLTYWVVVPFLVLSVVGLAALSLAARWSGPVGPLSFLGAVGLGVLLVDALLGWRGARIPLLGGTMFDGVRFYGLPNAFTALLLASALFGAFRLDPFGGLLLLVGAGLFAGFPGLGADIGGSITLFTAAGLWWVLRTRPKLGLREFAFAGGVVAAGLAVVLVAHRYLAETVTHASRFANETGTTGEAARAFLDRLGVGLRMLNETPPAYIPILGLPIVLWLVLARPGPIGWGLDLAGRAWRDVLVVLVVSGIVAFFVNDTGLAAAGPVFLYAMAGIAYPAWVIGAQGRRRGAREPAAESSLDSP
jgi:hypothetical protein